MKKILITGSSGMLGTDLLETFLADPSYEVYGLSRTANPLLRSSNQLLVDLNDPESLYNIELRPDFVIHAAAITDLSLCEREPEMAHRVHVQTSQMLAHIFRGCKRFIYISTDSVFDGEKGNYSEGDAPNPLNTYALTKWKGELAIQEEIPNVSTILRTNIYGFHKPLKNSFAEWAIQSWAAKNKINGFSDIVFNAVYTRQLSRIVKFMLDDHIDTPVLHVGSNNPTSKFEFLQILRQALNVEASLLKSSVSTDFPSSIKRPKDTSLSVGLLSQFYPRVPDYDEGVHECIEHHYAYMNTLKR